MLGEEESIKETVAKTEEHLNEMEQFTKALLKLEECTLEDFLADRYLQSRAERNLHGALESAMAVGGRLVVASGGVLPNNYEELFDVLEEKKIISEELARRLRRLEDFHNILIHGRIENWEEVYQHLERTDDFLAFVKQVREYVHRMAVENKIGY